MKLEVNEDDAGDGQRRVDGDGFAGVAPVSAPAPAMDTAVDVAAAPTAPVVVAAAAAAPMAPVAPTAPTAPTAPVPPAATMTPAAAAAAAATGGGGGQSAPATPSSVVPPAQQQQQQQQQTPHQPTPHGAPTRVYLNTNVTPHLLEGMKWLALNE